MIYRETVFDIISFGKSTKIHLAATASIERIKRTLPEYNLEMATDEKDTLKCVIDGDTFFIHSIFKMSYDDFVRKMVATDLTFNSLLMKPNGQIYDMYGGLDDLKNKRLSFVKSFNEEPRNHLTLNCIRYIFKNNFTYDEKVKKYIETTLRSFSRSEKTNALFYLVEFINKSQEDDNRISLILNDDFFKNDKQPNICIGNYKQLIDEIGKEKFIFLLLLLLHVNVNKTRFSTIIDNEEFHEIKDAFNLNLTDEITYYDLKERKGYDFLSTIITLQREYAKITCTEYIESEFHKKSVFDVIEQSNTASSIGDDFILSDESVTEKIKLPQKDAFDFSDVSSTDVSTMDFSTLFTEDESEKNINETLDEPEDSIFNEEDNASEKKLVTEETEDTIVSNENDVETDSTVCDGLSDGVIEDTNVLTDDEKNSPADKVVNETETEFECLESDEKVSEDNFQTISISNTEAPIVSEIDEQDVSTEDNTHIFDDELSSLLNADDDRDSKPVKKRSTNPNFNKEIEKENQAEEKNTDLTASVDTASNISNEASDTILETVEENITEDTSSLPSDTSTLGTDISESVTGELNLDEMFASSETNEQDERIQVERFERKPQTKAENLIDSIYDEEVKLPEISLSPELDNLVSQVADETKNDTVDSNRKVVTEVLMSDVVSDAELLSQSSNQQQVSPVQTTTPAFVPETVPENFEINEQDLEEILAELNGKKKNSFLDDDSVSEDNDIVTGDMNGYTPSVPNNTYYTPTPANSPSSESEDDFFKSLNDDFAEIVGGNN